MGERTKIAAYLVLPNQTRSSRSISQTLLRGQLLSAIQVSSSRPYPASVCRRNSRFQVSRLPVAASRPAGVQRRQRLSRKMFVTVLK